MLRYFGTVLIAAAMIFSLGIPAASASDLDHKYGFELRPLGIGLYDMGDVVPGIQRLATPGSARTLDTASVGPMAGLSFLVRSSRHAMWEVGYNALLDVQNRVENARGDSSAEILMHANEFFVKGVLVATLTERLNLNFGAGVGYYNSEVQIQDDFNSRYNYDAVGRGWGIIGTVGGELFVSKRVGLKLEGGGRLVNTASLSYDTGGGVRGSVPVIGGTRQMEVNLTGAYASLGLRIYFDPVVKPVDFTR